MNPALRIRTEILGPGSRQGAVLQVRAGSALISTAGGSKWVAMDIAVAVGDIVTVRGDRIISKRTGGTGGAVKVYYV